MNDDDDGVVVIDDEKKNCKVYSTHNIPKIPFHDDFIILKNRQHTHTHKREKKNTVKSKYIKYIF